MCRRRKPLDAVLRPGPARSSMSGARTLEEVIRWGSSELFANYPDSLSEDEKQQKAAASAAAAAGAPAFAAGADAKEGQQQEGQAGTAEAAAAGGDVVMQDAAAAAAAEGATADKQPPETAAAGAVVAKPAVQPLAYSAAQVEQVLTRGAAVCAAAAADATAAAAAGSDEAVPSDLGPGLEAVVVRLWPDVAKGVDQDCGECFRQCMHESGCCMIL